MPDHLIDYKYTVIEIDRMRSALNELLYPMTWTSRYTAHGSGGTPGRQESSVEQQLRTYMMAGTRPEELEAELEKAKAISEQHRLSFPE
jgi:hypothetical protein